MSPSPILESAVLVHLTDLHIKNVASTAVARLRSIAGAIGGLMEGPTPVIIMISGDIAYSGKNSQYQLALDAIKELTTQLSKWSPPAVYVVTSPGNHDCDFDALPVPVRNALLESDLNAEGAESIVDALAPTQSAFREFTNQVSGGFQHKTNQILSEAHFELGAFRIKFISVNTSLTSQIKEQPGKLRLPKALLIDVAKDADFSVTLLHHPLNWYTPRDAVSISEWLDTVADLVVIGHEHRVDEFLQVRRKLGSSVAYQVGLPVDDDKDPCGFTCLRIDIKERQITEFDVLFKGDDSSYSVTELASYALHHNHGRERGLVRFSKPFSIFLSDPGAGFSHPQLNRPMELADIFVPSDFRPFRSDKLLSARTKGSVSLDDLCGLICTNADRFVIFGAEQSGKTTFAKHLIEAIRSKKLVPLYLDGQSLNSINKGEIRGWFNGALSRQFVPESAVDVTGVDPTNIVLILDNAHSVPGGTDGIELVLKFLFPKAQTVVLLSADNPAVSMITIGASGDEATYLKGAELYELLPLSHGRRGELIRKWVSLGRNLVEDAFSIEAEVRQVKSLLDRILGKSALPKYPIFVLVLLQQLEGLQRNKTVIANASHGYIFEALVTQAIDRHVRCHKIGTVNDFLASVAYAISKRGGSPLSVVMINGIVEEFRRGLVKIDSVALLDELDAARVIVEDGGLFKFRYQYLYYYYLAKWICDHQDGGESERLLTECVDLIYTERSSNVLVFVAHLKHEKLVLRRVSALIEGLFTDQAPCNLEDFSGLCLRFRTSEQRAILLQGPASEVSDETNRRQDYAEGDIEGENVDNSQVEDGLKFNTMLKAINTLGQVLKSRASSIEPEEMVALAVSIMSASRRLMSFLYKVTEDNAEGIVHAISDAFERSFKINRADAVKVANGMIGAIVVGIARTCVGRAADAMGSFELEPLLERLDRDLGDPDSKLIILVARIIGERTYPKELVEDFARMLKPSNILPMAVLSSTVATRFYLEPPERAVRESACSLLGIDVKRLPSSHKFPA